MMDFTMEFADFLKSTLGSNIYDKTIGRVRYMKGSKNTKLPRAKDGEELHFYPIYFGKIYKNHDSSAISLNEGIAEEMKILGYWIPSKYLFIKTDCAFPFDEFVLDRKYIITVKDEDDFVRTIHRGFAKAICQWADDNMESVDPSEAGDKVENEALELFNAGHNDIDIRTDIKEYKCTNISDAADGISVDVLEYVAGGLGFKRQDIDKAISDVTAYIAERKAVRERLLALVKAEKVSDRNDFDTRGRTVKTVFNKLLKMGRKNCEVTFDFGYDKVVRKVNMSLPWITWIGNTRVATEIFEKEYAQPLTMKGYSPKPDDFLPYVTLITSGKKVYYETEPLENRLENKLYNIIIRRENDFSINEITAGGFVPDCSLFIKGRNNGILIEYVQNRYSTVAGTEFLIEHGADAGSAYEYMHSLRERLVRVGSWKEAEIFEYLKRIVGADKGTQAESQAVASN